jgi:hypothetical protein
MGETADRKVTEIEETRHRIDADLQELEDRIPAPLRSAKTLVGALVGTAGGAFVLRRLMSKRSQRKPATEVVVRVVRDDERHAPPPNEREQTWRSRRASKGISTD